MFKYLGDATMTEASLIVRGTTNGTATMVVNGVTYNGTVNNATNPDGLVRFDATGLQPGTRYSYTVTTQDETATGKIKTQSAGKSLVGWTSCSSGDYDCLFTTGQFELDALVSIGDEEYYEGTVNTSLANATNVSLYNSRALAARSTPTANYAINRAPFYTVHDDHEYGINDLRWDLTTFNNGSTYVVNNTTEMQNIIDAGAESTEIYNIGNPANTDASVDTNPFYFRFYVGKHTEVFVLSAVCYGRDPTDPTRLVRPDLGAGNMFGAKQDAWFRNALKTSTRKIKLIMSPKMTLTAEFTNADGLIGYFAQTLDDGAGGGLLPFIHAGTDWAIPGGVIWCTGDYHTPSAHGSFTDATEAAYWGVSTASYDHAEICASPAQKDNGDGVRDSGVGGAYSIAWVNTGQGSPATSNKALADDTRPDLRNFGVIEVAEDGSYADCKIITANGNEWFNERVLAGENKFTIKNKSVNAG